ncbi:MAG: voltage-gated chloride channel, partial [Nitrospirae bacterium]
DRDRRKLVICGISAGFSTVFGTPIAGAIFGIEVLYVGNIFYDALFPSFVSGVVAYQVAQWLGLKYLHMPGAFEAVFAGSFVVEAALAGIFFGLVSLVFVETMEAMYRISMKITIWPPLRAFTGGIVIAVLAVLFGRDFLGLGLPVIKTTLEGTPSPWYYFLAKMLFTSATLAFGGSGGIVTPIFFVGATAGSLFAVITKSDPATFAAVGMVSVLAGAANTPISASIMAIEMFGTKIGPYAAVVCIISYLITGHRSVYPSQMIVRTKSPTVLVETGKLLEEIERVEITPRRGTLFDLMLRCIDRAMAWLQWARELISRKKNKTK